MPAADSENDLQALLDGAGDAVSLDRVIGELVQSLVPLPQPEWSLGGDYIRGVFSGAFAIADFTEWVDHFDSHVESLECIGDWYQLESRFFLRGIRVQITAFGSPEVVSSYWALLAREFRMVKASPAQRQLARMCRYKRQPFDGVLLDELLNPQVPHLPIPEWDRVPGRIEGRFRSHVLSSCRDWSEQFLDGYINVDPSDIEQGFLWVDFFWMDQQFRVWGLVEIYRITSAGRLNWRL